MEDGRRLVHAICRAGTPLGHADTEAVAADGLQAVCSAWDSEDDEADDAWLADAAQRHHSIVQGLFEAGPVLPIRFGTLIEAADIAPLLQAHCDRLGAELGRLEGLAEWGVKLVTAPEALVRSAEQSSSTVQALDAELAASPPGRSYLLRRRREAAMADAVEERSANLVDQVRERLAACVLESADLPLPTLTPAGQEVIANLAFLLTAARQQEFETIADALAHEQGVELQLSGPWPPYSFVRLSIGGEGE